tara:strand:- start:169 stop:684 length:516 start_codon:yes stop_codon:yes gene_type:complete
MQDSSKLEWIGSKVTGSHNGVIDFSSGTILIKNKKIQSAELTVNMNTITCLDIDKKDSRDYFVSHLKSDDFFGVDKFPEATIKFVEIKNNKDINETILNCDLTIKGITNRVEFPITLSFKEDIAIASGTIIIDRTKYGIKYKSKSFFSDIGDKFIYDDFILNFSIVSNLNE